MKNKLKILEESCAHEKEKVRIKAEKGLLARVEKNERIMMLDTSVMNKPQRLSYDTLQK